MIVCVSLDCRLAAREIDRSSGFFARVIQSRESNSLAAKLTLRMRVCVSANNGKQQNVSEGFRFAIGNNEREYKNNMFHFWYRRKNGNK